MEATHLKEYCPLALAAIFFASKWDLIVINNLLDGPLHFSDLKEKISAGIIKDVTASSLTRILRKLELNGIIKREVKTPKGEGIEIIYSLTEKGLDLKPVILELKKWGSKYLDSIMQISLEQKA